MRDFTFLHPFVFEAELYSAIPQSGFFFLTMDYFTIYFSQVYVEEA